MSLILSWAANLADSFDLGHQGSMIDFLYLTVVIVSDSPILATGSSGDH